MQRIIFHVDLNSFFASVEQQNNPILKNKPVGILKALGRSCVIAASNEAKIFGIKTGMSLSEVKTLCPEIILVPANFPCYEQYTRNFIQLMHRFSDVVEVFSLDEVFLDVTDTSKIFGGPLNLAKKIQARIQSGLGDSLGVSIGIAKNKFLAKLASSLAPKKGFFVINDENQSQVLAEAKFEDVCGIGSRLSSRLNKMGIKSLSQLANVSLKILRAEFGQFLAKQLKCFSCGEDENVLMTGNQLKQMKSVSRTFTLYQDTSDRQLIKATIRNLIEEACAKLRQVGLAGRQFGLMVRGGYQSQADFVTRKTWTDSGQQVFNELDMLYDNLNWSHAVRFLGVWISLLTRKDFLPELLFETDKKQQKIWQTVDLINQNYGEYTVYPAVMLNHNIIKQEVNGFTKLKH